MSGAPRLLDAAVGFAQRGWHIFPLGPDTKGKNEDGTSSQLLTNGFKGASNDADAIKAWWQRWPDANIGLSLAASGLVAIDIDAYKAECKWDAFVAGRIVPATFTQQSARGGRHLVFAAPPETNFKGRLCVGVDIKHKGYIVLSPSTFGGRLYDIIDDRPPAPVPDWFLPEKYSESPVVELATRFRTSASTHEVRDLLEWIDPDLSYPGWIEVLQSLHDHYGGSTAGLAVAEEWSSQSSKHIPGEVMRKWSGFRAGGGVTLSTIAHRARQNGADLSAIARRSRPSAPETRTAQASPQAPETAPALDLSHDGLALALGRDSFDTEARYVAGQNCWYFWTGTNWQADDALHSLTRTRSFLRKTAVEVCRRADDPASRTTTRTTDYLKSHATVSAVAMLARANPASMARAGDFDRDILLLGTPDGTVDLRDGRLQPAQGEQMITRQTACGPAATGFVPRRWLAFLQEIMAGDDEVIDFLQRAAGYALTGSTAEHKLLFLYGSGRNGKSVFLKTLLDLWGTYGRRVPAATFLSGNVERHPTDLAGLRGARLAIASELPRGKTWDEATVKDLTGGDRMTARFMRQDFFEFDPQLTLMVAGNTQPSFRGVDEAIRSRVVLVPFAVTIPPERQDRGLADALRTEFSAILRWCIDGALKWQAQGLAVPEALVRASKAYFDDEDIVGQFLARETLNDDPEAIISGSDLIVRFNFWAGNQGLAGWTQRSLIKELKARGFEEGRTSRYRGVMGLRLR